MIARWIDAMRARPALTWTGVVAYLAITLPTHDLVQDAFIVYRDRVGVGTYHLTVLAAGILVAGLVAAPVLRQGGRRLWRWWLLVGAMALGSFVLCLAVSSEIVHYLQYALLALPLYALTASPYDTVVLGTILGAVDEGYQYLVLHPDWASYFDFNDVLVNAVGVGIGVVWLLTALPAARSAPRDDAGGTPRKLWGSPATWGVVAILLAAVLLLATGVVVITGSANLDDSHYLAFSRIQLPQVFWTSSEWSAKAFHILRPLPGTILVLLAMAPFAGLPDDAAEARPRARLFAALTVALFMAAAVAFPALGTRLERERRLESRRDWFADQKFGLLIHWGIYSVWGAVESWPVEAAEGYGRVDGFEPWDRTGHDLERFRREYFDLNRAFNPTRFDPGAWAQTAQDAGMRYVVFTAKHHDGFCMYDTAETDFRVTHPSCPFAVDPRADVLRGVLDAFRARGLATGIFFSKPDWHHPDYWVPGRPRPNRLPNYDVAAEPERWQRFVEFTHRQILELTRDYGALDLLELDGGWIRAPQYDIDMDRLVSTVRIYQPLILVADRAVGGPYENFATAEWRIPEEPPPSPWEMQIPVGWQMSFDRDDHYRPVGDLVHALVETVAKGGNLALGVGPRPDGTFPPEALERMRALGDWLRVNGEAIYGTRMAEYYRDGDAFLTRGTDALYAIVVGDEGAGPPASVVLEHVVPEVGSEVRMLGAPSPLRWRLDDGALRIAIPEVVRAAPPSAWAWAIRIPVAHAE